LVAREEEGDRGGILQVSREVREKELGWWGKEQKAGLGFWWRD
jgi:hypothetical protein